MLDGQLERGKNEIELCRFRLKAGAELRTEYKDFYDIQTEYDTMLNKSLSARKRWDTEFFSSSNASPNDFFKSSE